MKRKNILSLLAILGLVGVVITMTTSQPVAAGIMTILEEINIALNT